MTNGRFEFASSPGVAITQFTQADIQAGLVRFVHDGSGTAPSFSIYVSDGGAQVGPFAANISFTGSGGFLVTPTPSAGIGSGGGLPTLAGAVLATPAGGAADAGTTAYLRGPTEPPSGGADTDETPVEQPPAGVVPRPLGGTVLQDKVLIPDSRLPGIRVEADVLETKPLRAEFQVEPMRGQLEVLPIGEKEALDLDEERTIEVVLNSVRITGLAFSVGAVWWAARAAGLLASVLASSPAWRHVDPLPVLGRNEEEEEEQDVEEDKDKRDDEHRAAWVLDERPG